MVELKINTKYRVMGLPENVGRIENGDIVETTDIVQNLPFVGVVGITHPESAWIKKTFLFDMEKKPNKKYQSSNKSVNFSNESNNVLRESNSPSI
jgi:hypothetical protein